MKLFRQEFIWLVLEGEKTRQLDVQLQVYADQMLDEFTQGIEKKNQVDSTVTTYGDWVPHRFHVSDLITTDTNDDWRKLK